MADFDAFTGADTNEDPAADFLAREQNQFAELEGSAPEAQGADDDVGLNLGQNFGGIPTDFGEDEFSAELQSAGLQSADDVAALQNYDAIVESGATDFDPLGEAASEEASNPYSAIRQVDQERQEPEQIRKWREEQKKLLEEKDIESEKKAAEWRAIAEKELEDWYKHRAEQFEKTQKNNRASEEEFIKLRDETVPGQDWERVCRVCEFNPKVNKTSKDVSRMRGILLQLKQNPVKTS